MKEMKIGTGFMFEQEPLRIVKSVSCDDCYFFSKRLNRPMCSVNDMGKKIMAVCGGCMPFERADGEKVVFQSIKERDDYHEMAEIEIPSNLKLTTMTGEPKKSIMIDKHMIPIVSRLWKAGIVTTGCCQGYMEDMNVNRNVAWVQIDVDPKIVPEWLVELAINKTMEIIDKYATFPVYLYSPRCIPAENPDIYITRKHYFELMDRGYKFNLALTYVV